MSIILRGRRRRATTPNDAPPEPRSVLPLRLVRHTPTTTLLPFGRVPALQIEPSTPKPSLAFVTPTLAHDPPPLIASAAGRVNKPPLPLRRRCVAARAARAARTRASHPRSGALDDCSRVRVPRDADALSLRKLGVFAASHACESARAAAAVALSRATRARTRARGLTFTMYPSLPRRRDATKRRRESSRVEPRRSVVASQAESSRACAP